MRADALEKKGIYVDGHWNPSTEWNKIKYYSGVSAKKPSYWAKRKTDMEQNLIRNNRYRNIGTVRANDEGLALETSAVVSLTASITLTNTQLMHQFVFHRTDAVT